MTDEGGKTQKPAPIDATLPASSSKPAPIDATLPASSSKPAPIDATLPASASKAPPIDATLPASASKPPPIDATLPASASKPPSGGGKTVASMSSGTDQTVAAPSSGTDETVAASSSAGGSASGSATLPAVDRARYRVTGEVGRGGLGRVLRARDVHLERNVAVKELLSPDAGAQARFVREALITARLQHPSIVPIYDAGTAGDGPFYAMKLVGGRSLADALRDATTLDARLALLPSVIAVADAMAYAHGEKIIHRDLKPGNVLVGKFGETVVIDWGLAKDLTSGDDLPAGPYRASSGLETVDGAVMGTPSFMPPEQARGEDVDERADVYALGAILYNVLSGDPPHTGPSLEVTLTKVIEGTIAPLREREPGVPIDLEAIVDKALARDKADRYPTAKELAEDLHKFQTGQLVGAHEYTVGERMRRWLRKYRLAVAIAGAALVVLAGYGVWSMRRIVAESDRAQAAMTDAMAQKHVAEQKRDAALAQQLLVRAQQYAASGHTAEEIAVLRALAKLGGEGEQLAIEAGLIWKTHQRLARGLGREPKRVAYSADGARVAVASATRLTVFDIASGAEVAALPIDDATYPNFAGISPAGRFLVRGACRAAGACGTARIGELDDVREMARSLVIDEIATGKRIAELDDAVVQSSGTLAFADDDSAIAVQRSDHVDVIDASGAVAWHAQLVGCTQLAVARGGAKLAGQCNGAFVVATAASARRPLPGGKPKINRLVFTDGDRLLAIGVDLTLWDLSRNEIRGEGTEAFPAAPTPRRPLTWTTYVPGTHEEETRSRIVTTTSVTIYGPSSVVAPGPPAIAGGVFVTSANPWALFSLRGNLLTELLVDTMLPDARQVTCIPFAGTDLHGVRALDGGRRVLIDEQELPPSAPKQDQQDRYRLPTVTDFPLRQLRPAFTSESSSCLVWGGSLGPTTAVVDGIADKDVVTASGSFLLITGERGAERIAPDGTRLALKAGAPAAASADGRYVVSHDGTTGMITEVATNTVVRTWPVPADAKMDWIASDVVGAYTDKAWSWAPIDTSLPVRDSNYLIERNVASPYGVLVDGEDLVVLRVRDRVELARHEKLAPTEEARGALTGTMTPLPDDSGRILVHDGDKRTVVAKDGTRVELPPTKLDREPTLTARYALVIGGAVWDLATGKVAAPAATRNPPQLFDDSAWSIEGSGTTTRLVRRSLTTGETTERPLVARDVDLLDADSLSTSSDRRWVLAQITRGGDIQASALWDTTTGALLWIGSPGAKLVNDWIVVDGRAFRPLFDVAAVLHDGGARTNLRVCPDGRAVAVAPPPDADSVNAPESACH